VIYSVYKLISCLFVKVQDLFTEVQGTLINKIGIIIFDDLEPFSERLTAVETFDKIVDASRSEARN